MHLDAPAAHFYADAPGIAAESTGAAGRQRASDGRPRGWRLYALTQEQARGEAVSTTIELWVIAEAVVRRSNQPQLPADLSRKSVRLLLEGGLLLEAEDDFQVDVTAGIEMLELGNIAD